MATRQDYLNTIAQLESGGRQGQTSSAGATGIMQTMSDTRRDPGFGVRPAQNNSLEEGDRVGRDYALALLDHYKGDIPTALAAYNAGPGNVDKYGGVPPFKETRNYVSKGLAMLGQVVQYLVDPAFAHLEYLFDSLADQDLHRTVVVLVRFEKHFEHRSLEYL